MYTFLPISILDAHLSNLSSLTDYPSMRMCKGYPCMNDHFQLTFYSYTCLNSLIATFSFDSDYEEDILIHF